MGWVTFSQVSECYSVETLKINEIFYKNNFIHGKNCIEVYNSIVNSLKSFFMERNKPFTQVQP